MVLLHACRKYNLEVALVSGKTGAIKMLPLSDSSFVTVCNNYFNPCIAKIKYDFIYINSAFQIPTMKWKRNPHTSLNPVIR